MVRFFFFFQAEDGIRDLTVTGVQTCALPILLQSAEDWASATECERGRGLSALAGTPIADSTRWVGDSASAVSVCRLCGSARVTLCPSRSPPGGPHPCRRSPRGGLHRNHARGGGER